MYDKIDQHSNDSVAFYGVPAQPLWRNYRLKRHDSQQNSYTGTL